MQYIVTVCKLPTVHVQSCDTYVRIVGKVLVPRCKLEDKGIILY